MHFQRWLSVIDRGRKHCLHCLHCIACARLSQFLPSYKFPLPLRSCGTPIFVNFVLVVFLFLTLHGRCLFGHPYVCPEQVAFFFLLPSREITYLGRVRIYSARWRSVLYTVVLIDICSTVRVACCVM
jgi:hypothetical protein